jgi:pimeloyl-[acyl-carrier protein] methyl ester esterase
MKDFSPPIVLLVHGWGFDQHFFDPLIACLPRFQCVTVDLGFQGKPVMPEIENDRPVLAVGHSLGFLWLLNHRPVNWRAIVSINGFPRFTAAEDYATAQPARALDLMQMQFKKSPERVIAEFMHRCGGSSFKNKFNIELMADGLSWLASWDERQALADEKTPIFSLAGKSDQIVPVAMTEIGFEKIAAIQWHEGGHLLPKEAPNWCADRLTETWESLP